MPVDVRQNDIYKYLLGESSLEHALGKLIEYDLDYKENEVLDEKHDEIVKAVEQMISSTMKCVRISHEQLWIREAEKQVDDIVEMQLCLSGIITKRNNPSNAKLT